MTKVWTAQATPPSVAYLSTHKRGIQSTVFIDYITLSPRRTQEVNIDSKHGKEHKLNIGLQSNKKTTEDANKATINKTALHEKYVKMAKFVIWIRYREKCMCGDVPRDDSVEQLHHILCLVSDKTEIE